MTSVQDVVQGSILALISNLGIVSVADATSTPFDLVCERVESGVEIDGKYETYPSKDSEFQIIRLSIDLPQGRWCYQPCRIVGSVEVSGAEVRLSGGPSGLGPSHSLISRNSGLMVTFRQINRAMNLMNTYNCKKAGYTALPAQKF